jgi:hypothetical protein
LSGTTLNSTVTASSLTSVGTLATLTVTGNVTLANVISSVPNVGLVAGSYTTTFDNTGNITLPNIGNVYINSANTSGAVILNTTKVVVPGGGVVAKAFTANLALNTNLTLDNVNLQIQSQNAGIWLFASTVTGTSTYSYNITWNFNTGSGTAPLSTMGSISATTTPASIGSTSFSAQTANSLVTGQLVDLANSKMYTITMMLTSGTSPYGTYLTIERM